MATALRSGVAVERLDVSAYTIPTEEPESDGTLEWSKTTIVVVECHAGGEAGLGYTYAPAAAERVVVDELAPVVDGVDPLSYPSPWVHMGAQLRNAGRPGLGFCALSAVDIALWDLKARLLEVPLAALLGAARETVPIYASGGFTSAGPAALARQLGAWAADGIPRIKMKVGRAPEDDAARVAAARDAIGPDVELYVDANGAFSRKEALEWAERYAYEWGVTWFEEPVSSADFEGLRLLRDRGPAGLEIAAGEYAYVPADFRNLLGCVDCLQADVTRCGGVSGVMRVSALCDTFGLDLSGHTAHTASAHAFAAVPRLRHLERFHDHVRVESLLFDGAPERRGGELVVDRTRPGLGLELRRADAEPFRVA